MNEERRHPRTKYHAPSTQQWHHCLIKVFGRRRLTESCSRCPSVVEGKAEPRERRAWPRECVGHSGCLSRGSELKRQTSRPETPWCRHSQLAEAFDVVRDVPIMLRLSRRVTSGVAQHHYLHYANERTRCSLETIQSDTPPTLHPRRGRAGRGGAGREALRQPAAWHWYIRLINQTLLYLEYSHHCNTPL